MDKIIINGGQKLSGEVKISSAKNAVLPIIAASILSADKCIIDNTPMLEDVFVISDVLRSISADVDIDKTNDKIIIDTSDIYDCEPCGELVKKLRASFFNNGSYAFTIW